MIPNKIIPAILTLAGLMACSKSSSSAEEAAAASTTTGTTRTATGSVQATSVDQLNLTGALAINLPAVLTDSASSLHLAGSKSIEACLMKESMSQLVTQIQMISSTLCHIEAEGKSIPWNTPALLDFSEMGAALTEELPPDPTMIPEGAPTDDPTATPDAGEGPGEAPMGPALIGIYADDSNPNQVSVYICEGETTATMKLAQAFKIEGTKSITKDGKSVQVSKGTITISTGDDTMGTFKGAIGFDSNFTKEDTSALKFQIKFGGSGFSFAQSTEIESKDSGISKVTVSEVGTMSGFGPDEGASFEFKNAGIGMFDAENGHVFYSYSGGEGQDFATQACVDSDSYLVECSNAKFAEGGALHLTGTDVPGVLPSTFSPAAPSGFDCATADWSTKIKPSTDSATIAKHTACDADLEKSASGSSMGSCFSDVEFQQSSYEADIEFTEESAGDIEPVVLAE